MRNQQLALALCALPLLASPSLEAQATIALRPLGTYVSGLADPAQEITSAETAALRGGLMYVTNATDVSLDIVLVAYPRCPVRLRRVDLRGYGASVTSVDVSRHNLIAVAVDAFRKTDPGTVVFLTPGGRVVRTVQVGAGPDMVVFTPDGRRLLVANEGEPDCYGPGCTDPEGSVSVVDVVPRRNRLDVHTIGFGGLAIPAGVRIFGPGASPAQDLEPEYIAVSDDGRTAWVTLQENNAIARLDLDALSVTGIFPLGTKDHSLPGQGLDPSDRDSAVQIAAWANVRGMYQPDAIASFQVGGRVYLVSANEGDARDYAGFAEEARARGVPALAGIPGVGDNARLGRLTVTTSPPSGDLGNLYAFGARSFSIWDAASGGLVWDSGDQIEQVTAAAFPANFNCNNTSNGFDDRSDNKGPEPEGVAVGRVGGRTYAFVGLERIGGVVVYDVTVPAAPVFQQYFTTRDFAAATPGPDLGPEIVRFVEARQSPTGAPLLLIANEISGTVNLVALDAD